MVVYEEAMKSDDFVQSFQTFLKKCHNEEPLLFLQELKLVAAEYEKGVASNKKNVDQQLHLLRKTIRNLQQQCLHLIQTFIESRSKFELNLGQTQKEVLERWQDICTRCEQLETDNKSNDSQSSKVRESRSDDASSTLSNLSEKELEIENLNNVLGALNPDTLFDSVKATLHFDLKIDQFPRFVRSEHLLKFLKQKGEAYTRKIALDISKGYNVDIRFKPNDMKEKSFTDNNIYFGYVLAEDSPDWEVLLDKPNLQSYITKTSYVFEPETEGLKLTKVVMQFPYSFEDVYAMWVHGENHDIFDPMIHSDHHIFDYVSPYQISNDQQYSMQYCSFGFFVLPILKKREVPYVSTSVYDSAIDAFMFLGHTAEFKHEEVPIKENRVYGSGLFYYLIYRVGPKTTRVIHTIYSDAKMPFNSDFLFKTFWKKRSKDLYKGMEKRLRILTENGTKSIDWSTVVDSLNFKKSADDNTKAHPNRSWYKEYMSMKKISQGMADTLDDAKDDGLQ